MIGYAFCGSFCTHRIALEQMKILLSQGYEIQPIMSENVYTTDTRFGKASDLIETVETLCKREVIHTITEAERLGPDLKLDALLIAPCTGNTLAKAARGITDTAVTMAIKAHLRSDRPTMIALASNDALSANLQNIGLLLERKSVYFVPMRQDDPIKKPHSLVADFSLILATFDSMKKRKQIQPIFL
ncbi:MAG: dipicolinate synthase subunit B [Clostridia bacterium]|nr:dipicolinate synthase subunit B [Clostridia bacterium]